MAAAGAILVRTLSLIESKIRPGVTTGELDAGRGEVIRSHGGDPTFKGYRGFPASICASPNSMVVHGTRPLQARRGDVISSRRRRQGGWVADAARRFRSARRRPRPNSSTSPASRCSDAVEQCVLGNRLGDMSHAVQTRTEAEGLAVVRTLVGHGVGRAMHEDPQIPNYGPPHRGPKLEGMVLAVEPMTTAGGQPCAPATTAGRSSRRTAR